jgi:DNA modification methylase
MKIDLNKDLNILIGDVRETLKTIPAGSVNCCVTSPPYFAQRSYLNDDHESKDNEIGREKTPDEFIASLVEIFSHVKTAMRDDGILFVNIADTYCGTGDKGETVDPKYPDGRNGQKVANNRKIPGIKAKDMIGIPFMLAFAMRADGWYWRDTIIWAKACSGLYDGGTVMPESTKSRCTRSHEYILMFSKSANYYYDYDSIAEEQKEISLKRAFSNNNMEARKGQGDEQYAISGKSQDKTYAKMRERIESGEKMTRNRRSVWTVNIRPSKVSHYASYPAELIEPCILAGCPKGGYVLDPFGGTGTTSITANLLGRKAIHCDIDSRTEKYIEQRRKEILKQKQTDGLNIANGKITKARKLF